MREHDERPRASREAKHEAEVRRLLEQAGRRPPVPADDLASIKATFRDAWRDQVGGTPGKAAPGPPRRSWPRTSLALAATLLLTVGLGAVAWWWLAAPGGATPLVATVEAVSGTASVLAPGGSEARTATTGAQLPAGALLVTGGQPDPAPGQLAIGLEGGASLRLDAGSRVRLLSATAAELLAGALYVDTGDDSGRNAVAIHTPFGVARDVGTRFEVRLLAGDQPAMRVRVRDGEVRVEGTGDTSHRADGGEELTLTADGRLQRRAVAAFGPPWEWVLEAAPPFALEGRSLAELLGWVSRETGWTIQYAEPGLEAEAATITLHGTLGAASPAEAPAVVLPGAGLEHEVAGGVLTVHRPPTGR